MGVGWGAKGSQCVQMLLTAGCKNDEVGKEQCQECMTCARWHPMHWSKRLQLPTKQRACKRGRYKQRGRRQEGHAPGGTCCTGSHNCGVLGGKGWGGGGRTPTGDVRVCLCVRVGLCVCVWHRKTQEVVSAGPVSPHHTPRRECPPLPALCQ